MKRKVVSLVLSLVMILMSLPIVAIAEELSVEEIEFIEVSLESLDEIQVDAVLEDEVDVAESTLTTFSDTTIAPPTLSMGTSWTGSRQVDVAHDLITAENVASEKLAIYYTVDATIPTRDSAKGSITSYFGWVFANIAVTQPAIMRVSLEFDGVLSEPAIIHIAPAMPTPSISSGVYLTDDITSGVILEAEPGAKIHYVKATAPYSNGTVDTSDIADPTIDSDEFTAPISILESTKETAVVIKAIATYTSEGVTQTSPVSTLYYLSDQDLQKLTEDNIDTVISEMTLDEKINLLSGIGMNPATSINNGVAGSSYPIPRLGIPAMLLSDGPAGVRMGKNATVWMSPAGLASSWSEEVIEEVASNIAEEAKHYAVDIMLAPAFNIQRNPMGGRVFEYYSEDPVVSGTVASAYTRALQSKGVGVSLKHYAANNQEEHRMGGEEIISERALREIYLRGFEMAMHEKPWTVMGNKTVTINLDKDVQICTAV